MKLHIPTIFNTTDLKDNELLFLWFMGKMFDRYGYLEGFTLDGYDFKILLNNNPISHLKPGAISDKLKEQLLFGFLSDRRISIELSPYLKKRVQTSHVWRGEISVSPKEVEITDIKVIMIYTYLLGILGFMHNWVAEPETRTLMGHNDSDIWMSNTEAMKHGRLVDPYELNQLLKAFEVD